MKGTIEFAKRQGYSDEQAEVIGKIDDVFELAINAGLLSDIEVIEIGRAVGKIMMDNLTASRKEI